LKASKNFTLDWELGQPNRDSRVTNVLVTAELQRHLKTHTPRDSVLWLVSLTCQSGPLERWEVSRVHSRLVWRVGCWTQSYIITSHTSPLFFFFFSTHHSIQPRTSIYLNL